MALRIATRLPRLAIVGVVFLLASATLAVGAAKRLTAVPQGAPAPVSAPTLVVPDLSGQAFVFAKGTLEAADLLLEMGIIKQVPDISKLADTRFIIACAALIPPESSRP